MNAEWIAVFKSGITKEEYLALIDVLENRKDITCFDKDFTSQYAYITFTASVVDSYEIIKELEQLGNIQYIESDEGGQMRML